MSKGVSVSVGDRGVWYPPDRNGDLWAGNLWAMDGLLALPRAQTRQEAKDHVLRVEDEHMAPCEGCGDWFHLDRMTARFASRYCGSCWEAYKARNDQLCRKCHSPQYDCYC